MDFKEYLDKDEDKLDEANKMYKNGMNADTLEKELKNADYNKEIVDVNIKGKLYTLKMVTMHDNGSITLVAE